MSSVTVTVDIARPVAEVWDELSQLDRHVDWMSDAERIDFGDGPRRGVGTRMSVRTRVGPLVTTDEIIVTEWIEEETIGVVHRGLVTGTGRFLLESTSSGTRFTWMEDITFPWYLGGGLTGWFARPVFSWIWQRNLGRFAATIP
jgi:uncharacterized protein YndB with AHSA1/START domain